KGESKQIADPIAHILYAKLNDDEANVCVITANQSLEIIERKSKGWGKGFEIKRKQIASNVVAATFCNKDYKTGGYYVTTDGVLRQWGEKTIYKGQDNLVVSNVASVTQFRDDYLLFIKRDGTLWIMGDTDYVIGRDCESPVQIASDVDFIGAVGYRNLYFIKKDGALWGLGYNYHGQIGDGTTVNRTEPVQVKVPETPLSVLQTSQAPPKPAISDPISAPQPEQTTQKKPADETTDKISAIIEENLPKIPEPVPNENTGATSKPTPKPKSDNRSERIRRAVGTGLQIYKAAQGMKK
ncbi:MAG: hypothetical protein LBC74_04375, partial [Planctomycetaceae bacterium]|nr:hypothetical protein [Planctomycetaceae bacterium]